MANVHFSSKTDQWATPQNIFDALHAEFRFTLDVAADHTNAKCAHYYTKTENGLTKQWAGHVWMNPPYGKEISKWVQKAHDSQCLVVGLLPARTDTKWFHDYILNKAEIRFIKGRLKFGDATNSAPFPSMIVIWHG